MLKWYSKDAPISRKVQLGFGLLIAMVGAGAGYSTLTAEQTIAEVGTYRSAAKANVAAEEAVGNFTLMRVAARDYAEAHEAGQAARAATRINVKFPTASSAATLAFAALR